MKFDLLVETYKETMPKVLRALVGWGFGMFIMVLYCIFVLYLKMKYHVYVMLIGSVVSLILTYISIDIWWHYNLRLMEKNGESKRSLFRYFKD